MSALTIPSPVLAVVNGIPTTTSFQVAELFDRLHKNVLRDIQALECSPEFNRLNFEPVEYTDAKGERRPAYRLTKDGFVFLAMGFTGPQAARFKEAYITAFNEMEKALRTPPARTLSRTINMVDKMARMLRDGGVSKAMALRQAAAEVAKDTGIDLLANLPAPVEVNRIVEYIKNAKRYAGDRKFHLALALGMMPRTKLMKLMKVPARQFHELIEVELQSGRIRLVDGENFIIGSAK